MKRFTCFLLTVAALATAPAFAQEAVAAPTAQPTPAAKIIDAAQKPAAAASKPAAKAPKQSATPTKTPASSPAPASSKSSTTKAAASPKPTAAKSVFEVARVNPGKGAKTHPMHVETLGRASTVQIGEPAITRAQLSAASSGQESLKVTSGPKPESRNVAVIRLRFTKDGAKALHDLSMAAQGGLLAVLVDGQVIAMPKITEPITTGEWTISGNFTQETVKALVAKINAGK